MNITQKKKLLKAQQGELDAVILYQKLSEVVNLEEAKSQFLNVARDEGKHASILKEYTGEILKPKTLKARIVVGMYRVLGAKFTLNTLAKGELKSITSYAQLANDFPNIQEIIEDEAKHAEIAKELIKKL